jgi:hypothetical protein
MFHTTGVVMYSKEEHLGYFKKAANGNDNAFDYLTAMGNIFRLWDDEYDQDKKIDKDFANKVFCDMNFNLARNKFYQENIDTLSSFVFLSWNAWMDSNEWRGDKTRIKGLCAWFLRDFCNDIVPLVAYLTGGPEFVREFSSEYRYFLLERLVDNGIDDFVKKE